MNRTVLVTGGSGFIGSYVLCSLAERGDTVINFDIRPPGIQAAWLLRPFEDKIIFIEGSIDNWSGVIAAVKKHRPDAIVHIAAIVRADILSYRPDLAFRVNLGGTYNILEAARLFEVPRVVNFSTMSVLPAVQYEPVDANQPVMLATEGPFGGFYASAKIAAEAFCWSYHKSFGLDFITIRPSAVYGFGMQWPIFIKPMVENSVRGKPAHFEVGREYPRDYTHVRDITQLTLAAVDISASDVRDRVFYGATGEPMTTAGQVADIVKNIIPAADIEIGSGLTEFDAVAIRCRGMFDIGSARQQLGYTPRYTELREGIEDYIDTYRRFLIESE